MPKLKSRIIFVDLIVLFFLLLPGKTEAKKIAILDSILKPRNLYVHLDRAYITEKHIIHIISLKTGVLLQSFGKQGEGPGEFKGIPELRVFPDFLTVNSWGKIIFFDHNGRYINERKHQFGHHTGAIPLGDKYVAQKSNFSEKDQKVVQIFGIYDDSFNLLKNIFESPNPNEMDILPGSKKQPYPVINDNISLEIYDGRIYIADSRKGFYFKVFDNNGTWLQDINVSLPPKKVDDKFKKKMLMKLASEPWWGQFKNKFEPVFPKFYPEIRFFNIQDNKIYVQTFTEKGDDCLFLIYDITSKRISKVFLPRAYDSTIKRYDIQNGQYYYLRENEESDYWEMFVVNI